MITVQNQMGGSQSPFKTVNFSKTFLCLSDFHSPSILISYVFLKFFEQIEVTEGNSAYLGGFGITKPTNVLNVELDVEKRMQAEVLKRQVRIKEFFHDFDRLRKGTVGEAGVSIG